MHIARYAHNGAPAWGFVDGDVVRTVGGETPIEDAIAGGFEHLNALRASASAEVPLADVQLLAPLVDPPQFLGIGLNYRLHAEEAGAEIPTSPVSFGFYASAISGPGQPIELPSFTDQVDWEVELGIVVGKAGRDIAPSDALDHVAGYTIVNDVSARDVQFADGQWTRAKSFDTFKPMGPWVTTVDALGAADDLAVETRVNGEVKQSSTTADLIFDVRALISFLSRSVTLQPGSVISTGTPSGVGFAREPAEYLRAGDTVTVQIEGIGSLSNPVVSSTAPRGTDMESSVA